MSESDATFETKMDLLRCSFRLRLQSDAEALEDLSKLLTEAPSAGALSDVACIAHRLAGSAAIFGFCDLQQPAADVEDLALLGRSDVALQESISTLLSMMRSASRSIFPAGNFVDTGPV